MTVIVTDRVIVTARTIERGISAAAVCQRRRIVRIQGRRQGGLNHPEAEAFSLNDT